jgi:response regulator RpfG family c-di-GMP phosphodiesterase
LVQHFGNLKYYSKEALFQHKNEKYFKKWLDQIYIIKTNLKNKKWDSYNEIVTNMKKIILTMQQLKNQEEQLNQNILNIINNNRNLNTQIEENVQAISSEFIRYIYIILFVLLVVTIVFIVALEIKVYNHVSLSVDEIENKIQEGIRTIKELNNEIQTTQKEVVFTMGAIGERRSKETGNHVKRVAAYSKLLALHYGLSQEESEMLKQASPMHDIGKVAIPDAILNKPGRFTPEEREIMNTHAKLGYDMLKYSNRDLLKMAAIVAYEHHEKYDGTGYPQGLKGEDIHIYGRITALADVFDALGSDRVYKKAWKDEKIFNLIKQERGKQFEPKLVDIFFDNLDQFLEIRDKFNSL